MVRLRLRYNHRDVVLPFAKAEGLASQAAYNVLFKYLDTVLGPQDAREPYRLREVIRDIGYNLLFTGPRRAVRNFKSYKLYGYEFMDMVTLNGPIRLKEQQKVMNSGGWLCLTDIVPVLFCVGMGDVITPINVSAMNGCRWDRVPKKSYYLCATIETLRMLSARAGSSLNGSQIYLMQDRRWHCPSLLFGDCSCKSQRWRRCNRLQKMIKVEGLLAMAQSLIRPPKISNETGAVIFGSKLPNDKESEEIEQYDNGNHPNGEEDREVIDTESQGNPSSGNQESEGLETVSDNNNYHYDNDYDHNNDNNAGQDDNGNNGRHIAYAFFSSSSSSESRSFSPADTIVAMGRPDQRDSPRLVANTRSSNLRRVPGFINLKQTTDLLGDYMP